MSRSWIIVAMFAAAFALFYTTLGIPLARLADRGSRRNIIAFSILLWSAMTAASGLARNFVQLALARVAVGIAIGASTGDIARVRDTVQVAV